MKLNEYIEKKIKSFKIFKEQIRTVKKYTNNIFFPGANILEVLNSNSQLVAQEFGGPILDYAIDYAMNVTQRFFSTYTYDQISKVPLTEDFFENN